MVRKNRGWHPKGYFHIIVRGNNRQNIFNSKEDFQEYFKVLNYVNDRSPFELYAYCIMTNHAHLLMRSRLVPLGEIMAPINKRYSDYFRKKYNYVGQIYQNRYFSKEIIDSQGLLDVGAYIHRNPIETTIPMVSKMELYPYSSYQYYYDSHHRHSPHPFLKLSLLLSLLPVGTEKTAARYAKYCVDYQEERIDN